MNDAKKVMPEDIDNELVAKIWNATGVPQYSVRDTLYWLANNPIDLTPKAQGSITKEWDTTNHGWTNYVKFISDRTQRIAFLKKEPELPREVQQMIDSFGEERYPDVADCIRRAYKIGAGIK